MSNLDKFPVMSSSQERELWRVVTENEAEIGARKQRMSAISADPSKQNQAGAKEWYELFLELTPFSDKIDSAFKNLA
jgi:hypothetical protein